MIVIQAILIVGILFYIVPGRYRLYDIVLYDASENMPANPLIGYAPPAENPEDCENTDLVFLLLPFSELEPQEGVYDFDGISEKYHLEEYRNAGKHAVLRFVCDVPGDAAHRDIPDWLYAKAGDGTDYDDASGKGYSPDYENAVFIEEHGKALKELADWCKKDSFFSFVEIGSIGQNGSWTTFAPSAGLSVLPTQVQSQYAQQYSENFPEDCGIRLLSCPGTVSVDGAGEWNDVLGDSEGAKEWVGESTEIIEEVPEGENVISYEDRDPTDEKALDDYIAEGSDSPWMLNPVGGALTETVNMDSLLMENLSETLGHIRRAHVSFIGPMCPNAEQQNTNGSGMILRNVGYSIYLSRMQITMDYIKDDLLFALSFSNIGNAPFYWDWPVTMYVYDSEGECIRKQKLDLRLSQLLPDSTLTVTGSVPYSSKLLKGYSVGISIESPDGNNTVTMAQKGVIPNRSGIHKIYRYRQ